MMDLLPPGHVRWIDIVVMQTRSPFVVSGALHDSDGEKVELHHCLVVCHTRFLRPKPDAHRMYAQDQVVIHTVRM
jgi:hypothetical protein